MRLRPSRVLPAVAASALTFAAAAPPACAQRVAVDVRAGPSPVVGRYADEFLAGATAGVGVTRFLTPALGVRADASWTAMVDWNDASAATYTLGLEARLAATRGRVPLRLGALAGAGASRLRINGAASWHPMATGGVRLAAYVTRHFGLLADAAAAVVPRVHRRELRDRPGDPGGALAWTPVSLGVQYRF